MLNINSNLQQSAVTFGKGNKLTKKEKEFAKKVNLLNGGSDKKKIAGAAIGVATVAASACLLHNTKIEQLPLQNILGPIKNAVDTAFKLILGKK